MQKTRRQKHPNTRARLLRNLHRPNLIGPPQTVSLRQWTRCGRSGLVEWRQCAYPRVSTSLNRSFKQVSSLWLNLHQLVLLTTPSPSLSLNQPPFTSNRPTNQPLFISSLLIGLSLITGLVLQTNYVMYLYSAQYLHILQDSKRYLTNLTVQVQPQLTSN